MFAHRNFYSIIVCLLTRTWLELWSNFKLTISFRFGIICTHVYVYYIYTIQAPILWDDVQMLQMFRILNSIMFLVCWCQESDWWLFTIVHIAHNQHTNLIRKWKLLLNKNVCCFYLQLQSGAIHFKWVADLTQ